LREIRVGGTKQEKKETSVKKNEEKLLVKML
jgi:hypothetical protein